MLGWIGVWRYGWGARASVPLALVSLPRVPPLAPPGRAAGGGRPGDGGGAAGARGLHRDHQLPHPGRDDRGRVRRRDRARRRATRTRSRSSRRSSRWPTSGWSRIFPAHGAPAAGPAGPGARAGHRQARRPGQGAAGDLAARARRPSRGDRPGRRRRAAARLPCAHPALLPPAAGARGADHRRGLRRARRRPGHARMAPPALRPAPSADVVDGAVAPADHAHRAHVGLPSRASRPTRASSTRSSTTSSTIGDSAACNC